MVPRGALAAALALLLVGAGCSLGPRGPPTAPSSQVEEPSGTPTATPEPSRNWSIPRTGATDAPADGRAATVSNLAALPERYRDHHRAAGEAAYAVDASFRVFRDGVRTERLTVRARRGPNATADRVRRFYRGPDDDGNGTERRVRTTATYRTAGTGPTLYYRNLTAGGEVLRRESGTLQGAPVREALLTAPWRYRELAVRLAAAGDYGAGERATVDGETVTRYRASGVDRGAYDALGLAGDRYELRALAGRAEGDPYPESYRSTVLVGDDGRLRRVNVTLSGRRLNDSYRPVPTTVRLTAGLPALGGAGVAADPPRWVERTPRLWVRPLDEPGVALAVEHRGGPPVDVTGSMDVRAGGRVTAFPLVVRRSLPPGEALYVFLSPDDDGNGVEAGTAVGERPSGPFVRANLSTLAFDSAPAGASAWRHVHHVGVDRPAERGRQDRVAAARGRLDRRAVARRDRATAPWRRAPVAPEARSLIAAGRQERP